MSGIFGFVRWDDRPISDAVLAHATHAMEHRGPDGVECWVQDGAGLSHLLLRTTPEEVAGIQPLSQGDCVLVADIRLDNRSELADQLDLPTDTLSTWADSALLMAAFRQWGRDCLNRLVGNYAFVLWNRRERTLFAARDPMGVKPFYYTYQPGGFFAFSSEIKALLVIEEVRPAINEDMIVRYVGGADLFMAEREETCYANVYRLPMAQAMTIDARGVHRWTHWTPDLTSLNLSSDTAYADAFLDRFNTSVRSRLRSPTEVGSMLSGGLDSSAVTCTAREFSEQDLHTFSVVYPDLSPEALKQLDEREFIDAVIQQGGVKPHYVRGDQLGPFYDIDAILQSTDQPYFGPNGFFHWKALQMCNESGLRVLLDGTDGDTVVSHGHRYLKHLVDQGQWREFAQAIGADRNPGQQPAPPQTYFASYGGPERLQSVRKKQGMAAFLTELQQVRRRVGIPMHGLLFGMHHASVSPLRALLRAAKHKLLASRRSGESVSVASVRAEGEAILKPRYARRFEDLKASTDSQERVPDDRSKTNEMSLNGLKAQHFNDLQRGHWQYGMEAFDALSAPHQVEMRFPFFDRRVMEFCLRLPGAQQRRGGWGRYVLRHAMEGRLPSSVQWRAGKARLGPGFTHGMNEIDGPLVQESIRAPAEPLADFVDLNRVQSLYEIYRGCPKNYPEAEMTLYRFVVLDQWIRLFH